MYFTVRILLVYQQQVVLVEETIPIYQVFLTSVYYCIINLKLSNYIWVCNNKFTYFSSNFYFYVCKNF